MPGVKYGFCPCRTGADGPADSPHTPGPTPAGTPWSPGADERRTVHRSARRVPCALRRARVHQAVKSARVTVN
ncbi:hypothetical protein ABZ769_01725 [Streptomyces olivoreticuli]